LSVKNALVSTAICVVSVIVALAIGEGVLRLKNQAMDNYDIEMWRYARELKVPSPDPVLGHEHRPSSEAELQGVDIRINGQGLRGGPVAPRDSVERRILFLGSSVTLGWGVPEEQTLTVRLQRMFDAAGGPKTEVLNAGIGNYNTVRYVERFLTRLEPLKPTDIVVHYFVNDAEELPPGGGNFLLRHSELAVTLWIAFNRLFQAQGEASLVEHYRQVYRPQASGYRAMLQALSKLKSHADSHGVRIYLMMTPDVHNLKDYKLGFIHERLQKVAAEMGFRYLDLLPAFQDLTAEELWAMPGDPHPNARGHEIMAKAIFPALKSASPTN